MPGRCTPDSEIVRVTARRPFESAYAPEERIVPGIAALDGRAPFRDEPPVEGRVVDPSVEGRLAGSVAARVWYCPDPSPVPNDDELALPSRATPRGGATEFASEREDALDAFDCPRPMITGVFGRDGAGDDASEMGEMGGILIVCSLRSLPVLFGRLSCGGATS